MNAASHGCRRYLHFQRFAFSRSQQSGVYFLKHQFRSRPFSTAEVFGRFQRPVRSVSSASPRYGPKILLCALSPLVFVEISEHEEQDGRTAKEQMLDASTEEAKNRVPDFLQTSGKLRRSLYLYVDHYIIEPFMTGVRFLHLVVLFIPVILSVPAIYLGERQPQRSNERSGSIWWYGYLVWSMEKAGAAYIKLGQWAASRTDIFPTEMCETMRCLHSHAPAHSIEVTKRIIEKAFDGRKFDDIFDEFDEKPLGVGAIAQVYRAKLKPDLAGTGIVTVQTPKSLRDTVRKNVDVVLNKTPASVPSSYVAIKVLHPRVDRIVYRDLRIMSFFASIIDFIPTMKWLSFPDEVETFSEMMRLQLDLRIESANLSVLRNNFKDRSTAWFPFPYTEYTKRQVLIEEFAHGIPLETFLKNGGGPYQKQIAEQGLDAFLHMVLIDNFIHADLHPGNIMVRFHQREQLQVPGFRTNKKTDGPSVSPTQAGDEVLQRLQAHEDNREQWIQQLKEIHDEGYQPQVIFIDAGLVTKLNTVNRNNFLDLFKAIAEFDGYKAGHLMVEKCRQPEAVVDAEIFALRMQHLVLGVKSRTFALGNIKIGDILQEVLSMVRTHHVRLEGDFINVVLSILLLEGIGRSLDPDMDLFAASLPILRELGAQGGTSIFRSGNFSMLKVWAGLEARSFLQASIDSVERCVKYDLLAPNM